MLSQVATEYNVTNYSSTYTNSILDVYTINFLVMTICSVGVISRLKICVVI